MSKKTVKLDSTLKEKIRNQYVQGLDNEQGERILYSLDQLASEYNIGKSTLYRHAKADGWKMQQEQFQTEYLKNLDDKRKKEMIKDSINIDNTTLAISKKLLVQITELINETQAKGKVTPNMLSTVAEATYKVQRVAKLALGEATDNMNLNANVKDTDAFNEAMELLDEIANAKRTGDMESLH
jgi:DNA-binding MurR/RpiR family transcriptional regulator|tara:strand:+ start:42 stop:590 length:549 start_codon:yes stop_codon:yes gene_type:complete